MRKILGLGLYFMIVLWLTIGALVALSVRDWLFDENFYHDLLDNPVLYDEDAVALRIVAYSMANRVGQTPSYMETHQESLAALAQALKPILPEDYAREEFQGAADDFLAYIEGDSDTLGAGIDLLPIKDSLSEEGSETFAAVYAENLPLCEIGVEPFDSGLILPDCRSGTQEETVDQTLTALPGFLNALPDSLEITTDISFRSVAIGIRAVTVLGVIAAVFLLVVVSRIVGRGLRGWFQALGVLMLLPAGIVLLIGLGVRMGLADTPVRDNAVILNIRGLVLSDEFRDAVAEAVIDAGADIAAGFLAVGLATVLIALAVWALGSALPRRELYAS